VEDLPRWLTPLPDAQTMRAIDRWAIERQGVDGLELMERAGAAVAGAAERLAADGPVAVLCGKGNNGGDGLVAARLLREAGRAVIVICTAAPAELEGDARENLERLPGEGPLRLDGSPWQAVEAEEPRGGGSAATLQGSAAIIDALLGTGFQGEPRGEVATAIAAINQAGAPVLSVDVPSGVDASSGVVAGEAVQATVTVTFHAAKPGLWVRPGKAHAGEVEVAEIGIPRGAPMTAATGLLEAAVLAELPRRSASSNKFVSGHVLLAGGSLGLTGAPAMAARAAMRAGAGYVTAFVPAGLQHLLAGGATPELMTRGLPEAGGALADAGVAQVLEASARGGALALGPGLGREETAVGFARRLARAAKVPMVIDADGLNAHAGRLQELTARPAATVLTPHAGELGRLLELDSAEIEAERLRHACEAASRAAAIVVLKGDDTLIADPSGRVAVSRGGSPALATAGTGDVLTGVIAALLAQGLEPFTAAAAGVLLHARAGRLAAIAVGAAESVIASDVIEALPRARVADGEQGADASAPSRPRGRRRARGGRS
jgi:ADP-dependent NAD(P)H-hydrate dehydratase / NAD(P)H-hydrate epimerase